MLNATRNNREGCRSDGRRSERAGACSAPRREIERRYGDGLLRISDAATSDETGSGAASGQCARDRRRTHGEPNRREERRTSQRRRNEQERDGDGDGERAKDVCDSRGTEAHAERAQWRQRQVVRRDDCGGTLDGRQSARGDEYLLRGGESNAVGEQAESAAAWTDTNTGLIDNPVESVGADERTNSGELTTFASGTDNGNTNALAGEYRHGDRLCAGYTALPHAEGSSLAGSCTYLAGYAAKWRRFSPFATGAEYRPLLPTTGRHVVEYSQRDGE